MDIFKTPCSKHLLRFLIPVFLAAGSSAEIHTLKPEKIIVTILAVSSSVRTAYGGDEDVYLASLIDRRGNQQLIILSDWAPPYTSYIPSMTVGSQFRMKAIRTTWCDSDSRSFFLPSSAQERSQLFHDSKATDEALPLPCYRDLHESIHAVRKQKSKSGTESDKPLSN